MVELLEMDAELAAALDVVEDGVLELLPTSETAAMPLQ